MADKSTTNAHLYLGFDVDANQIPTNVKTSFLPIATSQFVGAVKPDGTTTFVDGNGIISAAGSGSSQFLYQLLDVNLSDEITGNIPDGNLLSWNVSQRKWVDRSISLQSVNNVNNVINNSGSNVGSTQWVDSASGSATVLSGLQVSTSSLALKGAQTAVLSIVAAPTTNTYQIRLPAAQGSSGTTLINDGTGILSWGSTGGSVSSVTMTVPTGFSVAGSTTIGNVVIALSYSGQIPASSLGSGIPDNTDFLRGDSTWQPVVSSVQVTGQPVITGPVSFVAGSNMTITQSGSTVTFNSTGGGGGGGSFSAVNAVWTTANNPSKNAYTSPNNVNLDGITIRLTATSNPGSSLTATVSLNTVDLTNTYPVTGPFPNYTITIPSADLNGNVAETAATVTVGITIGTQFNLTANNLTNVPQTFFTAALNVTYALASVPFYTTLANLNYEYTNIPNITTFGGLITVAGEGSARAASSGSGSFNDVSVGGATISGSVTGNGFNGAGQSTVPLSGTVSPLATFTPAFYSGASTGATPPTFTTGSLQTSGDQVGSTITFVQASSPTQYVWLATTRPVTSLRLVTALGPALLFPDVSDSQTISGVGFNVFGFTRLDTTASVQIQIIN